MKPPAPFPWFALLTVAALAAAVFAFLRPAPATSTVGPMPSTLAKPRAKKPARVARQTVQPRPRVGKIDIPADLRPLPAGALKFSKQETALMDRADVE